MAAFGLGKASVSVSNEPIEPSTPWMAASEGNLALMQSALSSLQLPITAADENGYTLLHAAASYNHQHVIQFLLQSPGMNVNVTDGDGDTPLHYAGSDQTARMLVEVGRADTTVKNAQGKTALEAKQEELNEMTRDEEVDDDDEDLEVLKQLVGYLSSL